MASSTPAQTTTLGTEGKVHGGKWVFGMLKKLTSHSTVRHNKSAAQGETVHSTGGVAVVAVGEKGREQEAHGERISKVIGASFGYSRNLGQRFQIRDEIARGGNGVVRLVVDERTGQQFAMKSIPKVLDDAGDKNISQRKRDDHADAIMREVDVLKRLRGCLNVASLEEVFEDDDYVHIVMENCTGGELIHRIGKSHYSERTVASFMRATLRTLAQCHANGILHRDIKPGNFLLASEKDDAPLKAIDFGLAVFMDVDNKEAPRTDLGLEGTPWYMAPETLQSQVYAESDIWAAGVMAYQLLTGKFPFNDSSNPYNPSLTKVWKSILMDNLNMTGARWEGVSEEAKDFVKLLLNKDPHKRPSAKEALDHPWLQGNIQERHKGVPLSLAVVQRIQRFSQASVFKRTVLELIADELLQDEEQSTLPSAGQFVCPLGENKRPLITHPDASPLEYLYESLKLADKSTIDRGELAKGLREMGYKLSEHEVQRLLDQLDVSYTGKIAKSQFAASQIDWSIVQKSNTERWISYARKVFADLDTDMDGVLSSEEMAALLRRKLPAEEVEGALRQAIAEAAKKHKHTMSASPSMDIVPQDKSLRDGLNFRQFLRLLSPKSIDNLDLYEERFGSPLGKAHPTFSCSFDQVDRLLEKSISVHGSDNFAGSPFTTL
jgi:calcium-dependent protein kinase